MQYSTKDFLTRAAQYCNKEHAAVFSFDEQESMLNEASAELYQYLVNTGDNYWLHTFEFDGTEVALPVDCYQIAYVKRNKDSYGDSNSCKDYQLANNKMKFKYNGHYIVAYYPNPKTLNFRFDIKKSQYQMATYNSARNGLFLAGASLYNSYSKISATIPNLTGVAKETIYSNGILTTGQFYSFKNQTISTPTIPVIYNDTVYFTNGSNIVDDTGDVVCSYTATGTPTAIVTNDFVTFFEISGIMPKIVNEGFVYMNGNKLIYSDWNGDEQLVYNQFQPVGYEDNMLITYDSLSGLFFNESLYNDTVLDYPSNIYVTIMAMSIALKMTAKQGVKNDQLTALYLDAKNILYNSIERDKYKQRTVRDVYSQHSINGGIWT